MPKAKAKTQPVAFNASSVGAFLQRFSWVACPTESGAVLWRRPDSTVTVKTGEAWDQTMKALAEAENWKLVMLCWVDGVLYCFQDGAPHFLGKSRPEKL